MTPIHFIALLIIMLLAYVCAKFFPRTLSAVLLTLLTSSKLLPGNLWSGLAALIILSYWIYSLVNDFFDLLKRVKATNN